MRRSIVCTLLTANMKRGFKRIKSGQEYKREALLRIVNEQESLSLNRSNFEWSLARACLHATQPAELHSQRSSLVTYSETKALTELLG